MKTTQKCMRLALQALVSLGLMGMGGAWGQVNEILLASKSQCNLYYRATANIKDVQLLSVSEDSRCKNGFYSNATVYGIGLTLVSGSKQESVRAGFMSEGRFEGVFLAFNRNQRGFLFSDNRQALVFDKSFTDYNLEESLRAIDSETKAVGGAYEEVKREFLKTVF